MLEVPAEFLVLILPRCPTVAKEDLVCHSLILWSRSVIRQRGLTIITLLRLLLHSISRVRMSTSSHQLLVFHLFPDLPLEIRLEILEVRSSRSARIWAYSPQQGASGMENWSA
jgi:hypothetical protein